MTNNNVLFLCIVAGAVTYLIIGWWLGGKEKLVQHQYYVILILGMIVLDAIAGRLFGV
jgi:hypothetical protein